MSKEPGLRSSVLHIAYREGRDASTGYTLLADARVYSGAAGSASRLMFERIAARIGLAASQYEFVSAAELETGTAPDIVVVGKAFGNGFPIAAVCGSASLMEAANRTWISSTLATESVSLAAAQAVILAYQDSDVVAHLDTVGRRFHEGLQRLADLHPVCVSGVRGLPQMGYLEFASEGKSGLVAQLAAQKGVLFKRSAYNFVSYAHTDEDVAHVLACLDECLAEVTEQC